MAIVEVWRAGSLLDSQDAEPGDLMIDLARFHGWPLHWRCGMGTCSTCRIGLPADADVPPPQSLETNTLKRNGYGGKLSDQGTPWRLACHVKVPEGGLQLHLPDED